MVDDWIYAPPRKQEDWDMDSKSYVLIRVNDELKRVEVRVMAIQDAHKEGEFVKEQKPLADYHGKTSEDIYYKIIQDGWISKLQHAAYLGNELQKAFIALRNNLKYIQDEPLNF